MRRAPLPVGTRTRTGRPARRLVTSRDASAAAKTIQFLAKQVCVSLSRSPWLGSGTDPMHSIAICRARCCRVFPISHEPCKCPISRPRDGMGTFSNRRETPKGESVSLNQWRSTGLPLLNARRSRYRMKILIVPLGTCRIQRGCNRAFTCYLRSVHGASRWLFSTQQSLRVDPLTHHLIRPCANGCLRGNSYLPRVNH